MRDSDVIRQANIVRAGRDQMGFYSDADVTGLLQEIFDTHETEAMKIKAIAPWFGSKRTLASRIVNVIGKHRVYWEPFCGSCSVLFAKERATYETVNDLHADLVNLALVLRDQRLAEELYLRVNRTLFHESLLPIAKQWLTQHHDNAAESLATGPNVDWALWYLIFSWMGLNGISGTPLGHTGTFAARYSGTGGNGATRWASVGDSIPSWHQRLVGIQILRRDAFEIIPRIKDEEGTAIYVDPPYLVKGAKYVHDFDSPVDYSPEPNNPAVPMRKIDRHELLAIYLNRFKKTRVVVSYYDAPRLDELYPGWHKIDCAVAKAMVNSGKRGQSGRTEAPEVLLVNEPPSTELLF